MAYDYEAYADAKSRSWAQLVGYLQAVAHRPAPARRVSDKAFARDLLQKVARDNPAVSAFLLDVHHKGPPATPSLPTPEVHP